MAVESRTPEHSQHHNGVTPPHLSGRDDVLARLTRAAVTSAPPLTVVAGEAGSGRSYLLSALHTELAASDRRVFSLRPTPGDRHSPYSGLYRLLTGLQAASEPDVAASGRLSPLDLIARLSATPDSTAGRPQIASMTLSMARQCAPAVVLIDDAHRLDDATAALLEPIVRRFAGLGCAIIATTLADPRARDRNETFEQLSRIGLAQSIVLRPLARRHAAVIIAEAVRARPNPELVEELHSASRGNAAALAAAIQSYRASDALRIVDRHAYLIESRERPALRDPHPLLTPVYACGPLAERVATAMAVLAPLGAAAPALLATSIEAGEDAVRATLTELEKQRVLVRRNGGWSFRVPMVRTVLQSRLGPYQTRRLSATAVQALWDGTAHTDDPHVLPDRLAQAGRLVDPQRAADQLLAHAGEVLFTDGLHATRWLRAAVERLTDPQGRALTLLAHSAACGIHNRTSEGVNSARLLLWNYADKLTDEMLQEAEIVYLMAVGANGDREELLRIAYRDERPVPGRTPHHIVARAFARLLLSRWNESRQLLLDQYEVWSEANVATSDFGNIFLVGVEVAQGDPGRFYTFLSEPQRWRGRNIPQLWFEETRHQINLLLSLGELQWAVKYMDESGLDFNQLSRTDQFLVRYLRGEWKEAMDTARHSMAADVHRPRPLGRTLLYWGAAQVLCASGWLSRSRHMIELGREGDLTYLFDFAESNVQRALGDHAEADQLLRRGLEKAETEGFELSTEAMWGELARRQIQRGEQEAALRSVDRLRGLAQRSNTGRTELAYLLSMAEVLGDRESAESAVALAAERGQPYESVLVFSRVALCGVRTSELLSEAYGLSRELDALLLRAQLRKAMRKHNVSIPGRNATTRENERLLTMLVTEGLSNRQLATVFGTTEKSVEGRLTRMFARTGFRSRVDLAAAMLTGEDLC